MIEIPLALFTILLISTITFYFWLFIQMVVIFMEKGKNKAELNNENAEKSQKRDVKHENNDF